MAACSAPDPAGRPAVTPVLLSAHGRAAVFPCPRGLTWWQRTRVFRWARIPDLLTDRTAPVVYLQPPVLLRRGAFRLTRPEPLDALPAFEPLALSPEIQGVLCHDWQG